MSLIITNYQKKNNLVVGKINRQKVQYIKIKYIHIINLDTNEKTLHYLDFKKPFDRIFYILLQKREKVPDLSERKQKVNKDDRVIGNY